MFKLDRIVLSFKTTENQLVKFELPQIEVSISVRKADTEKGAQTSILGMDFIMNNKLILCVDADNEYYLEKR